MTKSSRLRSIDALRGFAALAVVVHHSMQHSTLATKNPVVTSVAEFLRLGYLGVPLFFVISGFCIHMAFASGRPLRAIDFWKRRLRRLYPPYFAALIVSMSIVAIAMMRNMHVALASYPEPHWRFFGLDLTSHIFMLHGLIPQFDQRGGNPPFWSLAREEYYYALYLVLLLIVARRGLRWAVSVGFVVAMLSAVVRSIVGPDSIFSSALLSGELWAQWILGMLAVEAYMDRISLPALCKRLWLAPILGIAGFVTSQWYPDAAQFIYGLCFFQLINAVVDLEKTGRWPDRGVLAWLSGVGVFSYSLYLIHFPLVAITTRLLGGLGRSTATISYFAACAIICVVSYWAGRLFFAAVESRFLNRPVTESPVRVRVQAIAANS